MKKWLSAGTGRETWVFDGSLENFSHHRNYLGQTLQAARENETSGKNIPHRCDI
jgi:hypothetical protein